MSVSRRIVVSVAVLMVLAFGSLGYQLSVVVRMQRTNEELAKVNFVAASKLLEMTPVAEDIRVITKRHFNTPDPTNREIVDRSLRVAMQEFDDYFIELDAALSSWEAPEEIALLRTSWVECQAEMASAMRRPVAGSEDPPLRLVTKIDEMKLRTRSSYDAVKQSMADQVERNRALGSQAQLFSMIAGIVFLISGISLSVLTLRSINAPLRQLTRGTRKISSGEFSHRLPVEGPLEFADLAQDFNKMTEKLGELDQMKKDFVSHVSHELKAPLAAIRQTLAVTMEQIPGPINDQQRRLLQLSRNSAERLTAMVANLLDVSRLEAGTMEYEMSPQDLNEITGTVLDEFNLKAEERRIQFSITADTSVIPVVCDRDRMIQVVGNLVDNALKFAPPDSAINVNLAYRSENKGSCAVLSVADKGPGVPDSHKRSIFEKFHQVRGGGKRAAGQGVGLGLAICKTIVDAHHGKIWVEDNPGGGSIFRMEMTAQKQETEKCG